MPGFTPLFGGNNIYSAMPAFLSLNPLTANVVLQWPIEQSFAQPSVADIIEVNATAANLTIQFSDARQTTTGYCTLVNNIGAQTFSVLDAAGNVLAAIPSGAVWQLYLADNTSLAGTWRVFQFGAGASNANAAALAGAGLKAITTTLNENMVFNAQAAPYAAVNTDRAKVIKWAGGTGSISLPDPAVVGAGWFTVIKNAGTGIVTVTPVAGTIDLSGSLGFSPDESAIVATDGVNYVTIGFGQQINSIFDFIQIDLNGSAGNVVLAGAQLNRVSYRFVGALAGNVSIVVPSTIQQYWVDNETTGPFSLTVKTLAGVGVAVGQSSRNILYSDGANVTAAVTFGSTGFANGSAAAPGITFSSDPTTGFYFLAPHVLGMATNGVSRMTVDQNGAVRIAAPTAGALPALTSVGSAGIISHLVTNPSVASNATPHLRVESTAANGFAFLSIAANSGVSGTNDLSIFQNGVNSDATIMLFSPTGVLGFGTKGVRQMTMDPNGYVQFNQPITVQPHPSTISADFLGGAANGIAARFTAGAPGTPAIEIDNSATTGAQVVNFTGINNKPGVTGGGPSTWIPIAIGPSVFWVPAWGN